MHAVSKYVNFEQQFEWMALKVDHNVHTSYILFSVVSTTTTTNNNNSKYFADKKYIIQCIASLNILG